AALYQGVLVLFVPQVVAMQVAVARVTVRQGADACRFTHLRHRVKQLTDVLARYYDVFTHFVAGQAPNGVTHVTASGPQAVALCWVGGSQDIQSSRVLR